ncbi:hypothetical protein M426DRAFT_124757 [Hypoxylon sp. CI-4A]|nr:hypothetical protein M426DRAFT_124757 [Hypoxylon sp. CI-4A]
MVHLILSLLLITAVIRRLVFSSPISLVLRWRSGVSQCCFSLRMLPFYKIDPRSIICIQFRQAPIPSGWRDRSPSDVQPKITQSSPQK